LKIPLRQLTAITMLSAAAAAVRVGVNWVAFSIPVPLYGVTVKIGLSETLAFVCGYVFGPIQGFITGVLIIVVSDVCTWPGFWTPFIAAIIGLLGLFGGIFSRFRQEPSMMMLGAVAVVLTMVSEFLQNLWGAWYMWSFFTPETPFAMVFSTMIVNGLPSMITAVINNVVLFTALAPRVIGILREWVVEDE